MIEMTDEQIYTAEEMVLMLMHIVDKYNHFPPDNDWHSGVTDVYYVYRSFCRGYDVESRHTLW